MRKVLRSVIILFLIFVLLLILNLLPNVFKVAMSNSGSTGPMYYRIAVILHTTIMIIIGMLFGVERVYDLRLRDGRWKFDKTRLIAIIPLLFLSFSFSLYFSSRAIAGIIGPFYTMIDFESSMVEIARVITGIQIVNAIYRE